MTMFTAIVFYLLCALVIFAENGLAFTFPSGGRFIPTKALNTNTIAATSLKRNTDSSNQFIATKLFISRDEEEEFFQPEMDRKSFKEKLPIAIGVFIGKEIEKQNRHN